MHHIPCPSSNRSSTTPTVSVVDLCGPTFRFSVTMRCPNRPLTGEQIPQMQPLQQFAIPGEFWQPCPPQFIFNPCIAPQYLLRGPMPPQPQPVPQVPVPGEQLPWFPVLVPAAVSKVIKNDEKDAAQVAGDISMKQAAPADMSAEDEKTLIDAYRKQKGGELKLQEVFEELSKKNGHAKNVWRTWFIDNYERLESKVVLNANIECAPAGGTGSTGSGSQASDTCLVSSSRPSQSSTTTLVNDWTHSRGQSGSEWEGSSGDDQGSTSHDRPNGSEAPQRRATRNGKTSPTRVRSRAGKLPVPVTPEDLRAMGQYRFEKGDDREMRRYGYPRWREFAERPENHKRTLAAWTCIPRDPKHAAAIDRYVKEYQEEAEAAKSKMTFETSSDPGKQLPGGKISHSERAADPENANDGSYGSTEDHPPLKRKKTSLAIDTEDIIDLTVETEE